MNRNRDKDTRVPGLGKVKLKKLGSVALTNKDVFDKLPLESQLHLTLKPKSITRVRAKNLVKELKKHLGKIKIAGSYRRKRKRINDLDIITLQSNYKKINKYFVVGSKPIQVGKLKFYTYAKGDTRIGFYCRYNSVVVRIDLYITTKLTYPFMLVYLTGSFLFNIRMRSIAKHRGFLMNQNGLYKDRIRIPGLTNEKAIFKKLNMKYLTPQERDIQAKK